MQQLGIAAPAGSQDGERCGGRVSEKTKNRNNRSPHTAYVRSWQRRSPSPPDLWRRLAALDARCDFTMERYDANRPTKMLASRNN